LSVEIIAIAKFVPEPESREQVRAALERVTVTTHSEPGCLLLALHSSESGEFVQVGKWESLEHWQAHGDADSVRQLNREIEGLLASEREIDWYVPVAVGDPERNAV
jgi:quinol monooxygenase YgiN